MESTLRPQGIDALIGRDVLSHGMLVFNGHESQFTFVI